MLARRVDSGLHRSRCYSSWFPLEGGPVFGTTAIPMPASQGLFAPKPVDVDSRRTGTLYKKAAVPTAPCSPSDLGAFLINRFARTWSPPLTR